MGEDVRKLQGGFFFDSRCSYV